MCRDACMGSKMSEIHLSRSSRFCCWHAHILRAVCLQGRAESKGAERGGESERSEGSEGMSTHAKPPMVLEAYVHHRRIPRYK